MIGKNNELIIVFGAIILGVFIAISLINMSEGDHYYLSTNVIKDIDYNNGKLNIVTRDDIKSICVKQTKTDPSIDALCWVDTVNDNVNISIYEYKTYYIWVKDNNNLISYYAKYNTKGIE